MIDDADPPLAVTILDAEAPVTGWRVRVRETWGDGRVVDRLFDHGAAVDAARRHGPIYAHVVAATQPYVPTAIAPDHKVTPVPGIVSDDVGRGAGTLFFPGAPL